MRDEFNRQGLGAQLASRVQHLRRVTGFAATRLRAVKQDHDPLWSLPPEQAPDLPEAQAAAAKAFVQQVDLALRHVAAGEKLLGELATLPAAAALMAASRFDPERLTAALREVDARLAGVATATQAYRARQLEERASAERASRSPTGRLGSWFQAVVGKPPATTTLAPPASRGTTPLAPPKPNPVEAYRRQLDSATETVKQLLGEVSLSLGVLRAALEATALPVPRRPWPEVPAAIEHVASRYGLEPVQVRLLTPIATQLYADGTGVRPAHVAVTQWLDALRMLVQAELTRELLPGSPPERQREMMQQFHPGRLRAVVLPLSHLHLAFEKIPVLCLLFPRPGAR